MKPTIVLAGEGQSLLGGRQTIKLAADQTDGRLGVMLSEVPAGGGIPAHVHQREDELFQVIEGELEITVGDQTQLLRAGDLIFLPRGVPHGFKANSFTRMWVSFTPGGNEAMFVELAALSAVPGARPGAPPDKALMAEVCARYGITFV